MKDLDPDTRSRLRNKIKLDAAGLYKSSFWGLLKNSKLVRAELRGFFRSLKVSPDLAKDVNGGFYETGIHRVGRYVGGFRPSNAPLKFAKGSGSALILSAAVVGIPHKLLTLTCAGLAGISMVSYHKAHLIQSRLLGSHNFDPRQPNGLKLLKEYEANVPFDSPSFLQGNKGVKPTSLARYKANGSARLRVVIVQHQVRIAKSLEASSIDPSPHKVNIPSVGSSAPTPLVAPAPVMGPVTTSR